MTLHELSVALGQRMLEFCEQYLPAGKRVGRQWVVGNIQGQAGESCYIELEGEKAGVWFDHAAGTGGDALDAVIEALNLRTAGEAAKWARQWLGLPPDDGRPSEVFNPLRKGFKRDGESEWRNGTAAWPYHDKDGQVFAYAVRFEVRREDGTVAKDVMPLRFMPNGELPDPANPKLWRWKGWKAPEKTPLFNLHKLARRPDDPVLIVEGEKTAVAAEKIFPEMVVTTWQGGSKRVERADWEILLERKTQIILWPDADDAGRKAMTYLKARFPDSKLVRLPDSLPDGWDLADPVPDGVSVRGIMDATLKPPAEQPKAPEVTAPFRCLGYDEDGFHYLSHKYGSVVTFSASDHTEMNLQMIAGDDYWFQAGYFKQDSNGVDYKAVAKALLNMQAATGYYNPDLIRGIGCWIEKPSDYPADLAPPGPVVVYHAGHRLFVAGKETAIENHKSRWIYPRRRAISVSIDNPLTVQECAPLVELCELAPWSHTESNMPWILAAMVFVAPICGAMDWRPSIWITGGQGSGKTWTYSNVLSPLLGDAVIKAQSCTTEAGIRQTLLCDALPVIMDEIEGNSEKSQGRIQSILELVRQASAESGGSIYKGTAFGGSKRYRIRSSFVFSSIASAVSEAADEARIARLEFSQKAQTEANFIRMREIAHGFTDEYCRRFRARAISKAPQIREAASVFLRAIAEAARDSRKGQQYGTLAAAFWFLTSDQMPSIEEAAGWAQSINWEDKGAGDQSLSDEHQCLDVILQYRLKIQDNEGKSWERTVMELIHSVFENNMEAEKADETLTRWGVYVKRFCKGWAGGVVDVALRHTEIDKITKGTPFGGKHGTYLARINGAAKDRTTITGGKTIRVVRIPRDSVLA